MRGRRKKEEKKRRRAFSSTSGARKALSFDLFSLAKPSPRRGEALPRTASSRERAFSGRDQEEEAKRSAMETLRHGLPFASRSLVLFVRVSTTLRMLCQQIDALCVLLSRSCQLAVTNGERDQKRSARKGERRGGLSMAAVAAKKKTLLYLHSLPGRTYVGLDPAPLVSDSRNLGGDAGHGV